MEESTTNSTTRKILKPSSILSTTNPNTEEFLKLEEPASTLATNTNLLRRVNKLKTPISENLTPTSDRTVRNWEKHQSCTLKLSKMARTSCSEQSTLLEEEASDQLLLSIKTTKTSEKQVSAKSLKFPLKMDPLSKIVSAIPTQPNLTSTTLAKTLTSLSHINMSR